MKALVGLGNVGEKYKSTRHNIGFIVLDYLASAYSLEFSDTKKLHAQIAKNNELVIAKPTTMMNSSGKAIAAVANYFKVELSDLYVFHDDLDLKLGEFKIQFGRGPKVHNGINSIEETLHTKDFWRVRIGVDNRDPENRTPGEQYVLQNFTEEEMEIVNNVVLGVQQEVDKVLNG